MLSRIVISSSEFQLNLQKFCYYHRNLPGFEDINETASNSSKDIILKFNCITIYLPSIKPQKFNNKILPDSKMELVHGHSINQTTSRNILVFQL